MSMQVNLADTGLNVAAIFKGGLIACTTDGVSSTTTKFLDTFGARFPVAPQTLGPIAEVCDKQQRTVLGALKVAIGYRRGDSTSMLACSAGGQSSIAFIVAVTEMFELRQLFQVITGLATDETPSDVPIPSARDLNMCIEVLHHLLDKFSFNTHYANIVTAIRRVRVQNGVNEMDRLTSFPPQARAIELLRHILSCQRDETTHLGVEGNSSMGIFCAAASWWYPCSVKVPVDDTIIIPCEEKRVRITMRVFKGKVSTTWVLERRLDSLICLLPESEPAVIQEGRLPDSSHGLKIWPDPTLRHRIVGLVPGALRCLGFPNGKTLDKACLLVATLVFRFASGLAITDCLSLSKKSFMEYIGGFPNSLIRVNHSIQKTCGTVPADVTVDNSSLEEQLENLVRSNTSIDFGLLDICVCPKRTNKDESKSGGIHFCESSCSRPILQLFLRALIFKVFVQILVSFDDDYQVVIGARNYLTKAGSTGEEYDDTLSAFTPNLEQSQLSGIRIVRGAFIHRDQYYHKLVNMPRERYSNKREINLSGIRLNIPEIQPEDDISVLKSVQYSVVEGTAEELEVKMDILDHFHARRAIDIPHAIGSASLAVRVGPCEHPRKSALDSKYASAVILGTVSQNYTSPEKILVLLTARDYASAMCSCDTSGEKVILDGGCINCGISKAMSLKPSFTAPNDLKPMLVCALFD